MRAPVTAEFVDGDVVHVLLQGHDPFADDIVDVPDEQFRDPDTYDFSIAWMTDTQYLSEGAVGGGPADYRFAAAYRDMADWIVDEADNLKIDYVAHTGDIINNSPTTSSTNSAGSGGPATCDCCSSTWTAPSSASTRTRRRWTTTTPRSSTPTWTVTTPRAADEFTVPVDAGRGRRSLRRTGTASRRGPAPASTPPVTWSATMDRPGRRGGGPAVTSREPGGGGRGNGSTDSRATGDGRCVGQAGGVRRAGGARRPHRGRGVDAGRRRPGVGPAGHPAPAAAAAPALAHPFGEPQTIRISATAERVAIRWQAPADDLRMLGGSLGALSDRQVVVVEPGGVPQPGRAVRSGPAARLRPAGGLLAAHIVVRQSGRGGAAVVRAHWARRCHRSQPPPEGWSGTAGSRRAPRRPTR